MIFLAACAAPLWAQDTKKGEAPASRQPSMKLIRGRVVDTAGRPVAGMTVATHWIRAEEGPPRPFESVKTDDQGRFHLELTFYPGRPPALYALDFEGRRGGLADIGAGTADQPITIQAGPLIYVQGQYVCKELGTPIGWTNSIISRVGCRERSTRTRP